jgi:dimethylhistidine N-methyltransferase
MLFSAIMQLPEYYLTQSELEIFSTQGDAICSAVPCDGTLEIIELGAGDGTKTLKLLEHLQQKGRPYVYKPVDISSKALEQLEARILAALPAASVEPYVGDYFTLLGSISATQSTRLVLFLGSNIGNFQKSEAIDFLRRIREHLKQEDRLLVGFDLVKHPKLIREAYNDRSGVTKAFNLNLLQRINETFEGDFDLQAFDHYESYDPELSEARSYLISIRPQEIHLKKLEFSFHMAPWEFIHVEISRKFTQRDIHDLALRSGLGIAHQYMDCKHYFTDTLLKPLHS